MSRRPRPRHQRIRTWLMAALISAAALALAVAFNLGTPREPSAASTIDGTPPAPTEPAATATSQPGSAAALAASLPLIDESVEIPRYQRASFGERWQDIDRNGCDQRQDVLARDLTEVTRDRCTVLTGFLLDPYTGASITFQHDRVAEPGNPGSQGVQIDHVVSLSAAHAGGAWRWKPEEREAFANTLSNLLAVDGKTNQAKGDRGPSAWMPPDSAFACEYAQRYTEIVSEWHLSVRRADRDALAETLVGCGR